MTPNKLKSISEEKEAEALRELDCNAGDSFSVFLTNDKNGKSIFYISYQNMDKTDKNGNFIWEGVLAIYDWWGNFIGEKGAVKIKDPLNFKDDIILLKEANGWCSFPFAKK